jgi:uncharacterized protein YbjT (DUF2867 family)
MNITLFGGTGFVGHALTAQLINAGHHVTVPVRNRERAKKLAIQPQVSVVEYNSANDLDLARVMKNADAVINLVGILHERRSGDFDGVHVGLTERILKNYAGTPAGKRYIHMSALGADVDGPSKYQQSKGKAEAVVRASDAKWTILAPSVVFGEGDSFVSLFNKLLAWAPPFLPLAVPKAGAYFQPVWVNDVCRAVVRALANPSTVGQRYELGGPMRYPLREIIQHAGSFLGRTPLVISTPPPFANVQAFVLEKIPGGPLMSRDNVRSMSVHNITDQPWPAFIGQAPAQMEHITPAYLGKVPDEYAAYRKT